MVPTEIESEEDTPRTFASVDLMGVAIHAISEDDCVDHIIDCARRGQGGWVVTPNLDHLRRLVQQPGFRELCGRASLRVADGMPLVWASRIGGTPLPERVAGSNLVFSLTRAASRADVSISFVGGNPGTAERAAAVLQRRFPALDVRGTHCPAPGFESDPVRLRELGAALQAESPGLVYVALGSPKQEQVIDRMRNVLPHAWWLGVGISFSFVAGEVHRAPRLLQLTGLEWLHRLAQEPRRLARRYLLQGLPFAAQLLLASLQRRLTGLTHA
jgi:N-acetylglucosaminyldiphosphoundecaprenol N-acetyl-beta-D-mannosaminyltransferase